MGTPAYFQEVGSMSFRPLSSDSGFDMDSLNQEFDRAKTAAFLGDNGAFLGPLMCGMEFIWTLDVQTAATDGIHVWWNPNDFLELTPELRKSTLLHEIWHPANLHFARMGDRDPKKWNIACDIDINNNLKKDGYAVESPYFIWDEKYRGWAVEDIYADLPNPPCAPRGPGSAEGNPSSGPQGNMPTGGTNGQDMAPQMSMEDTQRAINNVIQAAHTAVAAGKPGAVPGSVVEHINKFLTPKVAWDVLLDRFLDERCSDDYTYRRPNRRYPDIYMPSLESDERLTHLAFYWDVSGSTTGPVTDRMNSEVKAIKTKYNPEKMTIVIFDTKIQKIVELTEDDPFDGIDIQGRGGTCFKEIRQHMMDVNPTAAIIFSDMYVTPMQPGPKCPTIWIAIDSRDAKVPFGQLICINA